MNVFTVEAIVGRQWYNPQTRKTCFHSLQRFNPTDADTLLCRGGPGLVITFLTLEKRLPQWQATENDETFRTNTLVYEKEKRKISIGIFHRLWCVHTATNRVTSNTILHYHSHSCCFLLPVLWVYSAHKWFLFCAFVWQGMRRVRYAVTCGRISNDVIYEIRQWIQYQYQTKY